MFLNLAFQLLKVTVYMDPFLNLKEHQLLCSREQWVSRAFLHTHAHTHTHGCIYILYMIYMYMYASCDNGLVEISHWLIHIHKCIHSHLVTESNFNSHVYELLRHC